MPSSNSNSYILRLIKEYAFSYKLRILFISILVIIIAGLTTFQAWIFEPILDHLTNVNDLESTNNNTIIIFATAIFLTFILRGLCEYYSETSINYISRAIHARMKLKISQRFLRSHIDFYHQHSSGYFVSMYTNETREMSDTLMRILLSFVKNGITALTLLIFALYQSYEMTLISILSLIIVIYPVQRLGQSIRRRAGEYFLFNQEFVEHVSDIVANIRIIKFYTASHETISSIKNFTKKVFRAELKLFRRHKILTPISDISNGLAFSILIFYGSTLVLKKEISVGELMSLITALGLIYRPCRILINSVGDISRISQAAERYYDVIFWKSISPERSDGRKDIDIQGNVEFRDVSFGYSNLSNKLVLENVNFTIEAGETIAIVGESGSGKTTIVDLILQLYDPVSGKIFLENHPASDISISHIRQNIAYVDQNNFVLNSTIRKNLLYGLTTQNIDDDEIYQALTNANLNEFIDTLPQKLDTIIGHNGAKLSGGQIQRLMIAKAFLKKAPILILDEATSALDNVSEYKIQQTLETLTSSTHTKIIIAHRLSTIRNANRIIVLDKGHIVEIGTHAELLTKEGIYAKMHNHAKY